MLIQGLAGSEGSTMNLIAQNSSFTNTSFGAIGIDANWTGIVSASIAANTFIVAGGSNEGVHINNNSPSNLTSVAYTNNSFTSEGGSEPDCT